MGQATTKSSQVDPPQQIYYFKKSLSITQKNFLSVLSTLNASLGLTTLLTLAYGVFSSHTIYCSKWDCLAKKNILYNSTFGEVPECQDFCAFTKISPIRLDSLCDDYNRCLEWSYILYWMSISMFVILICVAAAAKYLMPTMQERGAEVATTALSTPSKDDEVSLLCADTETLQPIAEKKPFTHFIASESHKRLFLFRSPAEVDYFQSFQTFTWIRQMVVVFCLLVATINVLVDENNDDFVCCHVQVFFSSRILPVIVVFVLLTIAGILLNWYWRTFLTKKYVRAEGARWFVFALTVASVLLILGETIYAEVSFPQIRKEH